MILLYSNSYLPLFKKKVISLKNIYVDSHTCDEDVLLLLVKTLGSDHIVIGSDYPFHLGEL